MAKTYPPLTIVNEQDEVVGNAMLADAEAQGLIYRVVFAILENSEGKVLLQRRAPGMRLFPNRWDISAGGHVDDGFTYETAMAQELQEEIGVTGQELEEVAHFYSELPEAGVTLRYWTKIYCGRTEATPTHLAPDEVSEVQWFTLAEIADLIQNRPEQVAEGLRYAWVHVLSKRATGGAT